MKTLFAFMILALGVSSSVNADAFNKPVKLSYYAADNVVHYDVSCANGLQYELIREDRKWCIGGADASQCETKKMRAASKACRLGKYIVGADKPAELSQRVATNP
ncbi:Uncharacterised protein [Zhongshania aliphaticivorans]|uniref:Uncharacterized protein n=2 Tax=Zhongshania aliphaticivorans TaxID=1470434 RepID=A0A5S9MV73_9GAMM|nr:Uncharacterised protein [Zhongshania aliphaticivorans]CAA0084948.1 Uncharacterised protein [Zhongshania aliphaticivorans]